MTSSVRESQGANSVADLLSHGGVGRLPLSEVVPASEKRKGVIVMTSLMAELALLKSVVTGSTLLKALPVISGGLLVYRSSPTLLSTLMDNGLSTSCSWKPH